MKIKVYNDTQREEEVILKLVEECGTVKLVVVNKEGHQRNKGQILRINKDGTIYLFRDIDRNLGFSFNKEGRINFQGEVW